MKRILLLAGLLAALTIGFACSGPKAPADAGDDTPTEAYKRLYAAVKANDLTAIRAGLTRKTIDLAASSAKMAGKTEDEQIRNGMTATTFADELPPMRDERMKDNMGAVEVWNSKESKWEDLPYMIEDGRWKLAFGEAFGGAYKLPGKGRALIEREAANALNPQTPPNMNAVASPPSKK